MTRTSCASRPRAVDRSQDALNTHPEYVLHVGDPRAWSELPSCLGRPFTLPPARHVADVYGALAALARQERVTLRAVVLDADSFGRAELEFFRVLARVFPRVAVFVHGGPRSATWLSEALSLGARDLRESDALAAFQQAANRNTPSAIGIDTDGRTHDMATEQPGLDEPASTAGPDLRSYSSADAVPSDDLVTPATADAAPIRVPWRDYTGTPLRTPPAQPQPVNEHTSPLPGERASPVDEQVGGPPDDDRTAPLSVGQPERRNQPEEYEPLLTEEELRALLEDEFPEETDLIRDPGAARDEGPSGLTSATSWRSARGHSRD